MTDVKKETSIEVTHFVTLSLPKTRPFMITKNRETLAKANESI